MGVSHEDSISRESSEGDQRGSVMVFSVFAIMTMLSLAALSIESFRLYTSRSDCENLAGYSSLLAMRRVNWLQYNPERFEDVSEDALTKSIENYGRYTARFNDFFARKGETQRDSVLSVETGFWDTSTNTFRTDSEYSDPAFVNAVSVGINTGQNSDKSLLLSWGRLFGGNHTLGLTCQAITYRDRTLPHEGNNQFVTIYPRASAGAGSYVAP